MKIFLTTLFLSFTVCQLFGQSENKFAKEVFKTSYRKENYPKYDGKIVSDNNILKFGNKTLALEAGKYKYIFEQGIFNPDIVFGKETTRYVKTKVDSLTSNQKVIFNLTRNDSLSICCVEELTELNPNSKTKRFKFWLFKIGVMNPTEYYFELYNDKATGETPLEKFFENAIMTFYFAGTIII